MALRKGLGPVRHIEVGQLWIQDKINSGDIGIEKVGGKTNLADTLTKHSDSGSLETHISGTCLQQRAGRHHEAPNVAGDEVIENIIWGENEESDERCGIDPEGNKGEFIGHVHACCKLKRSTYQGTGSMAAKAEPIAGREVLRDLRTSGVSLRDDEISRFADIQSGAVADRENMRQRMLGKVSEEVKLHDGRTRDLRRKHEREIDNENEKHRDQLSEIQRDYDKEINAFEGVLKMNESALKHLFEEKRERIQEQITIAGLRVVTEVDGDSVLDTDFGDFKDCDTNTGMIRFEAAVTEEKGECVHGKSRSLFKKFRDMRSTRSRSRERKEGSVSGSSTGRRREDMGGMERGRRAVRDCSVDVAAR